MSVSEMKLEITTPSSAGTRSESQPRLIPSNMPEKRGKKGRTKVTHLLVQDSLSPTLPIAVPELASALQEAASKKSDSAPSSPNSEGKSSKSKPFFKRLHRPTSPMSKRKYSDPFPGGRTGRPKWLGLGFRNKKRSRSAEAMNGSEDSVSPTPSPLDEVCPPSFDLDNSNSGSSVEPEATPVATLPGQKEAFAENVPEGSSSYTHLPTPTIMITVSTHGGMTPVDEGEGVSPGGGIVNGFEGDPVYRKFSQSSQKSQCSTLHSNSGTSGVGSMLSPSGDECEPGSVSDIESPLSPLSGASSFRGSNEDLSGVRHFTDFSTVLSEIDCIDKDFSHTLTSPGSDTETLALATSPPQRGCSPPIGGGEDSGNELSGGRTHEKRAKRRGGSKPWDVVKRVVQVWSPFALQFKKRNYRWVQLAGHQGNFAPGKDNGTIMKKSDDIERLALQNLMEDELRPFVPEFRRVVNNNDGMFVEMTDLLREFVDPLVMDIKLGVRTYLEVELEKARTKKVLRKDMYEKMMDVDPNEPTAEEHAQRAITKPRYMQWRESVSSTSSLGFRIEGIKTTGGKGLRDFKTTKARSDVLAAIRTFLAENRALKEPFLKKLLDIRSALERSEFFRTHELIGSSLLFVYNFSNQCTVHMIDFGKTVALPEGVVVDHRSEWVEGNHEDGYLWGLDNLIEMWQEL